MITDILQTLQYLSWTCTQTGRVLGVWGCCTCFIKFQSGLGRTSREWMQSWPQRHSLPAMVDPTLRQRHHSQQSHHCCCWSFCQHCNCGSLFGLWSSCLRKASSAEHGREHHAQCHENTFYPCHSRHWCQLFLGMQPWQDHKNMAAATSHQMKKKKKWDNSPAAAVISLYLARCSLEVTAADEKTCE